MGKAAVMGDYDSVYGFQALGLDVFAATGTEEDAKLLRTLADGEYGIIYVTEALAKELEEEISRYKDRIVPAIIPIPGVTGNTGSGIANVKKFVEQAVGSDILFQNDET